MRSFSSSLRRILAIWWPESISNQDLWKETDQLSVQIEIRKRKLNWIGHTLRKPDGAIEKGALQWIPKEKGK